MAAMGVDNEDPIAVLDILPNQMFEKIGFSPARRADDVGMLKARPTRQRDRLTVGPSQRNRTDFVGPLRARRRGKRKTREERAFYVRKRRLLHATPAGA